MSRKRPIQSKPDRTLRWKLAALLAALLMLIGLSMAWSLSSLKDWLDLGSAVTLLQKSGQSIGGLAAIAGFTLAAVVAVPLTFLTLLSLVAFGAIKGYLIATVGGALGALLTFGMGKLLGHDVIVRYGGPKVNMVSKHLARRGVLAVIAIRLVPVAPFAIINLIAGSTHLRLRDMMLGTVLGMAPGTLGMAIFIDRILAAMKQPTPTTLVLPLVLLILLVVGILGARKWVNALDRQAPPAVNQQDTR